MSEFSITVSIADRNYKLTIEKEEEETVRKASKLIDEKVKEYARSYAFKDRQDLLAMVALQYTTSSLNLEKLIAENKTEITTGLQSIITILDEQ
ncbi:MAG: cell division protein ZapA [Bacteroidota bacterium]|jgi:cell division protein ZapA